MGINDFIQIGNRIRKERLEQGYTQKEIAQRAGIPYSTYSNYENNNREPGYQALKAIAKALNVPVDKLWLTSTEEVNKDDAEQLVTLAGYYISEIEPGVYYVSDPNDTGSAVLTTQELNELTEQVSNYVDFLLHKLFSKQKEARAKEAQEDIS